MSPSMELLDQRADDALDPGIADRRQREQGRCDERDPHDGASGVQGPRLLLLLRLGLALLLVDGASGALLRLSGAHALLLVRLLDVLVLPLLLLRGSFWHGRLLPR